MADVIGLEQGVLVIITITWSACALLLSAASVTIPRDIEWKRRELAERAKLLAP